MNLMIVPGMFVYSSFQCMYVYCVESFVHIECYSDFVRAGGAIWLKPFATMLFSVCSALTVECCVLCPCCMVVFGMFAVM